DLHLDLNACLSMLLRYFLPRLLSLLLPTSIATLVFLYLYPVFHGCAFPIPDSRASSASAHFPFAFLNTVLQHIGQSPNSTNALPTAPFRLLVLADPQIEGDSSLPTPEDGFLRRLAEHGSNMLCSQTLTELLYTIRESIGDVILVDI